MPNFDACKRLWDRCAVELVYVGNTYQPAWMDGEGGLRHDAHIHYTRMLLEPLLVAYGNVAAEMEPRS
jgi:hypothetical protein